MHKYLTQQPTAHNIPPATGPSPVTYNLRKKEVQGEKTLNKYTRRINTKGGQSNGQEQDSISRQEQQEPEIRTGETAAHRNRREKQEPDSRQEKQNGNRRTNSRGPEAPR